MNKERAKEQGLDIALLYVEDKKKHKVKDIVLAIGTDEDAKMRAYLKLTEGNTNITSDDVINSIEVHDIQDAIPTYVNHKI